MGKGETASDLARNSADKFNLKFESLLRIDFEGVLKLRDEVSASVILLSLGYI